MQHGDRNASHLQVYKGFSAAAPGGISSWEVREKSGERFLLGRGEVSGKLCERNLKYKCRRKNSLKEENEKEKWISARGEKFSLLWKTFHEQLPNCEPCMC